MTDYTARNVLLKDSSGNYLIPYTEKADLSLGNLNSAGKAYVAIKGYDSTATYSLNEVVMTVVSGSVLFYRSLVDNNTASLSDTTKWSEVSFGSGANIDLSNLSSTGEAHFADPSLSNLTNGLANTICTTTPTTTSTATSATPAVVVENYRNGDNGYVKFSDGFILQYGQKATETSGQIAVTFLTPFSHSCSVQFSRVSSYGGSMGMSPIYWANLIQSLSLTGFNFYHDPNNEAGIRWMACGY